MALDFPKLFKHLTDKSNPHSITTTQIGAATTAQGTKADNAVPKTTTVNGKALSGNISLTASDVGASSTSHTHSQYATLATPTFTGTPKAPTATAGTNNTQIATTAFVQTTVANANPTATKKTFTRTMASAEDWADDIFSFDSKIYNFIVISYESIGYLTLIRPDFIVFTQSLYERMVSIPLEAAGVHSVTDGFQGYISYSPHTLLSLRRDSNGIIYVSVQNKAMNNYERTCTITVYSM